MTSQATKLRLKANKKMEKLEITKQQGLYFYKLASGYNSIWAPITLNQIGQEGFTTTFKKVVVDGGDEQDSYTIIDKVCNPITITAEMISTIGITIIVRANRTSSYSYDFNGGGLRLFIDDSNPDIIMSDSEFSTYLADKNDKDVSRELASKKASLEFSAKKAEKESKEIEVNAQTLKVIAHIKKGGKKQNLAQICGPLYISVNDVNTKHLLEAGCKTDEFGSKWFI